jgi:Putative transposase/Transposase zinc-binding domain
VTRCDLELAQVVQRFGNDFLGRYGKAIRSVHRKALHDIEVCRTAELGGHVQRCDTCDHMEISYNSCRNRNCPKCQSNLRAKWMQDREAELLPVPYFHVVFTLPNHFNNLALQNPREVYGLLFKAASQTLIEVGRTPKHLGANLGFLCVLHTWGQNLMLHPHLHCIVPGGGLSIDGTQWISNKTLKSGNNFLLPVRVLSKVFRGKFISGLKQLYAQGKLQFHGRIEELTNQSDFEKLLNKSVKNNWVVYAKQPFGGPAQVLKYLSRYTHRVAISNQRLIKMDEKSVTFQYKDYADQSASKHMRLSGVEFLRRFFMHVLPRGFTKIRHYGWMANRDRTKNIASCRVLIAASSAQKPPDKPINSKDEIQESLTPNCPVCRTGKMQRIDVPKPLLSLLHFLGQPHLLYRILGNRPRQESPTLALCSVGVDTS